MTSQRSAQIVRKTNETDVSVSLNIDGTGIAKISTGVGFFDHMLDQLARHSLIDMDIQVKGDLHIDDHHTVEDTGIAWSGHFQSPWRTARHCALCLAGSGHG